jgi:hypothetical protein
MKYYQIEPMCHPRGGVRGCPHDGLGCTGGNECSINNKNPIIQSRAYNADMYGSNFICQKRLWAEKQSKEESEE